MRECENNDPFRNRLEILTVRSGTGTAIGIVAELMDMHSTLRGIRNQARLDSLFDVDTSADASLPLISYVMVVASPSELCSNVTVPETLESPRRTATGRLELA